jgi:hypothetical protein
VKEVSSNFINILIIYVKKTASSLPVEGILFKDNQRAVPI